MNKIFFIILFVSLHVNLFADNITIIYIDISDRPNLERVIEITKQIVYSNTTDEFLVFISYGNEPILIDDINNIEEELIKLNETPSPPFINDDIDKLNTIISKRSFLKNNNVTFNFLLTPSNSANIFINRLLLTNRLINRDGLISNIGVNVYPFGDRETEEYKSNCKIFKEKKYEIKN